MEEWAQDPARCHSDHDWEEDANVSDLPEEAHEGYKGGARAHRKRGCDSGQRGGGGIQHGGIRIGEVITVQGIGGNWMDEVARWLRGAMETLEWLIHGGGQARSLPQGLGGRGVGGEGLCVVLQMEGQGLLQSRLSLRSPRRIEGQLQGRVLMPAGNAEKMAILLVAERVVGGRDAFRPSPLH